MSADRVGRPVSAELLASRNNPRVAHTSSDHVLRPTERGWASSSLSWACSSARPAMRRYKPTCTCRVTTAVAEQKRRQALDDCLLRTATVPMRDSQLEEFTESTCAIFADATVVDDGDVLSCRSLPFTSCFFRVSHSLTRSLTASTWTPRGACSLPGRCSASWRSGRRAWTGGTNCGCCCTDRR